MFVVAALGAALSAQAIDPDFHAVVNLAPAAVNGFPRPQGIWVELKQLGSHPDSDQVHVQSPYVVVERSHW